MWQRWWAHLHFSSSKRVEELLAVPSHPLLSQGENTEGWGSTTTFPSILAHGMWLARVRAHKQRLRRPACTQPPIEWWLTYALLPHSQSFTIHWSTTSTTSSTALAGVICHYQVTEKVFADGCNSANLFPQSELFTIVAHLQYNHLHAVRGSMQHVTSTSCWHTATAFHLLIIITFTFTRLWEETRSKCPSFTLGNFNVTIPTCSKVTLHIGSQLEQPLHILPTCSRLHVETGTSQKYVASSSIKKVNEVVDLLI